MSEKKPVRAKRTKKSSEDNKPKTYKHNKFTVEKIVPTLEKNYMPYAMSVIVSRAIPEIDGFKPSHRKLLYTMYKMNLLNGPKSKSANIVGQTMKLNPHGDMAIYETMVRLTRGHEALNHPYVDSKGNFGKHYSRDMAFAASRYTECKLDKFCEEIFKDLDKDAVDFLDNYDGTLKEPVLFPTTFPNILVNANQGIAVGMASNICSFNLKEICEATIAYMNDKDCDLTKYIIAPDFSTGGELIYKKDELISAIDTGRGSFTVRGRYKYFEKDSLIEIYEIPYTTTVEAIIESIIGLVKSNKIKEIVDIRDETDLSGMKITIDVKKNTDVDLLMGKLFKMTPLQDNFSCNFNLLINGRPQLLGVRDIIKEWLIFRVGCIRRQLNFDIKKQGERLHLLKGLNKILLDIDKAIKIIRETENDTLVIPNLMWGFSIDEVQAEFVAEIKLRNLNKDYILNKVSEIDNLTNSIKELKEISEDKQKIYNVIEKQLKEVAKRYGIDRKTIVIHEDDVEEVEVENLIEDYNVRLFLTKEGYFKKIPLTSLRQATDQKLKDDDIIIQEVEWHNKSEVLFFTDKRVVYKAKVYEFEDSKASVFGDYLSNILEMDEDENVVRMVVTDDYSGQVVFAFKNGKVTKTDLEGYATKTNRKKLINAYGKGAELVNILFVEADQNIDIAFMSSNDKILIVNSNDLSTIIKRDSNGNSVMRINKNCHLANADYATNIDLKDIDQYRSTKLPHGGYYIKDEDGNVQQLSLL